MRRSSKASTARTAPGMLGVLLLLGAVATACAGGAKTGAAGTAATNSARVDAFWERAKQEIYKSPAELSAQRARELRKGLAYDVLARGDRRTKTVALTFDDGPHPQFSPQLLTILRQHGVKATFFVVGEMAEKSPDLIRAEQSAGHLVGNHTYHHVNLTKIPADEVRTEWEACQDVVKSITGETMGFCRPPGGDYDDLVIKAAMATGLTTVLWTDDPGDYASPGDKVIEGRVLDRIGDGGIILLHDGVQQTIDVLPQIIERLQHQGYRFVTVAEMQAGAGPGDASDR
jgi:peptidoglycan/xylan/chitin deacetylase (PgdA/CDA1 family)